MGGPTVARPGQTKAKSTKRQPKQMTKVRYRYNARDRESGSQRPGTETESEPGPDIWAAESSQDLVKVLKNAFAFMPNINHHQEGKTLGPPPEL